MTTLSFDVLWRDRGAERGMRQLGDTTEKTSGRFKSLKLGAVGAIAAVGVASVKFGSDSVKAFVEAEGSQIKLQEAFRKFPKLADTNIGSLEKLNATLAQKTKYDDDATSSGQAVLAQFGLTGRQITQLTPLLQDYASKTGKDLPSAAKDLGKAVMGQGRALKNVGLDLKDTGSATGNLDQLMGGLRSQVGGFASKEGKSAAGRAEILKNQFGELQEAAGAQLLPALMKLGGGALKLVGFIGELSPVFRSFRRVAGSALASVSEELGLGRASFRNFADFILTHQEDIISGFSRLAKTSLSIGKAILTTASAGLRGFALLMDNQTVTTEVMLNNFGRILKGSALAFGWIPGIGPKLKVASATFDSFAATAVGGMRKASAGARAAADGIDNKLKPALDSAGRAMDRVADKEIVKARTRDAVHRAKVAVDNLGTSLDGGQIKLRRFADRSKLSADEQAGLRTRLSNASSALRRQIDAMRDAHAGQDKLSAAWKRGRDRLYDEFRQMGLSRAEAKRLANQYAGIKPKVRTDFDTPGLKQARGDTRDLDQKIANLSGKRLNITFSTNAGSIANRYKVNLARGTIGRNIPLARGGQVPGNTPLSRGDDVAFPMATGGIQPLRGGEGIYVTEAMRDPRERARMYAVNQAALRGESLSQFHGPVNPQGLATGGVVNRVRIGVHGDISAPNFDKVSNRMGVYTGERLGSLVYRQLAKSINAALDKARAKQAEQDMGSGGGGTVAAGPGWGPIMAAMRKHGARNFTTYPGHHPSMGMARDVTPHNWAAANAAKALSSVWYVIYRMRIASKNHGNNWDPYRPTNFRGDWRHVAHIHVARRRDKGGMLRSGELAVNSGGADERILSPVQTRAFERMVRVAERGGVGNRTEIHISFPNYVGDKADLRRALVDMNRLGQLAVLGR